MNTQFHTLEFDQILNMLAEYSHGTAARERLMSLCPVLDEALCKRAVLDTTGARCLLEKCGTPPVAVMDEMLECLHLAQAGAMLQPGQLYQIARFIVACRRMSDYLKRGEQCEDRISFFGRVFTELSELQRTIESSVDENRVLDDASPLLRKLRREMENLEERMRERLHKLMQSKRKYLADEFISQRNGHYVLPVLRQHQNQFAGVVIDSSRSGSTVFLEPASVTQLKQEWDIASVAEEQESIRILYELSDQVAEHASELTENVRMMDELDFLFAKGAFSLYLKANEVIPCQGHTLKLIKAHHPLLDSGSCVPLDVEIGDRQRGLVITGPNTGGKTVSLKTVGLFALMAQSGLHIPCGKGSSLPMFDAVFCDIGDSQSISQNLSTFSGHMTNVVRILRSVSHDSLVLLDEPGSGTDPAEGTAIAIAVLEALRSSGCHFLATTHFEQVKNYVQHTDGLMCARMAFDPVHLRPLYQLEMGKAGKSCALEIIRRLGMPQTLLTVASKLVQNGYQPGSLPPVQWMRNPSMLIRRTVRDQATHSLPWQMGDSVEIMPEGEKGIVYQPADEMGNVIVQVKDVKIPVRHTRLKLLVSTTQLYPDDYDFSIVFDTVENRKARHILSRRYDEHATVVIKEAKPPK